MTRDTRWKIRQLARGVDRTRRDRLLFIAAVCALLGAVVAGIAWNLARAWGA